MATTENMNKATEQESTWTPPKYWQDLKVKEKIERLREEIKGRDRSNAELTRRIRILEEQFKTH